MNQSVGLLVNPLSFRASRGQLWQRAVALAEQQHIPVQIETAPSGFSAALAKFQSEGAGLVVILGGDGTLQGLLSERYRADGLQYLPPLMMLGGGRTNLIAANQNGASGDVFSRLKRVLAAPLHKQQLRACDTFVLSGEDLESEVGLFMAGAMIDEVIRDLHHYRDGHRGRWRDGAVATSLWMTRRLAAASWRSRPFTTPEMTVRAEMLGQLQGGMRLLILSTLARMGPNISPWASRGVGALRLLSVRAGARRFWSHLPGLLQGRFHESQDPASGYLSGRSNQVRFEGLHRFCIDGQEFESASGRICAQAGPVIHFVDPLL